MFDQDPPDITSPSLPEYPIKPYVSQGNLYYFTSVVHNPYKIEPPLNELNSFIVNANTPFFGSGCSPTTFEKLPTLLFLITPSITSNCEFFT